MSSVYSLAYLGLIMVGLLAYARYYNHQKKVALQNTAQFYANSYGKDIYEHIASSTTRNGKLEKASLMAWAAEDLARTFKMQETKAPLNSLSQSGQVGDDLVKRFMGSEVLMRQQVQHIAQQAEKLSPGGGQTFAMLAQEIAQNNALRKRLSQLEVFENEFRALTAQ